MMLLWVMGGLLLLAGGLLTYLLKPHKGNAAPYRLRLHRNRRVLRLMRRLLRSKQVDSTVLPAASEALTEALHRMNRRIASLPPLPAGPDGEPRLMDAARDAADAPAFSSEALLDILSDGNFTSTEVLHFPICVACAVSHRLGAVLSSLLADVRQADQARRMLRSMLHSKQPARLMRKCTLNSYGLHILFCEMEEAHALALLDMLKAWLSEFDLEPEQLAAAASQRSARYDAEIRRAQDCFSVLQRMDWRHICSAADEAHTLLLNSPEGFYPLLETNAQLQLRLDIDALSRRTGLTAAQLIRQAFILCSQAAGSSLESCISYYFQDVQGLSILHRSLPTRRGRLYVRMKRLGEQLHYFAAWAVSIVTGLGFLQSGQPVFLLPFFAVLVGCVYRLPRWAYRRHLPGMQLLPGDQTLRTLVVLHADLASPEDAILAVQRLKQTIRSFHGEQADFLLIGDFGPCITAVSGYDLSIMQAAGAAVTALGDSRVMYLQRGRAWDDAAHCYRARGGQRGAITEVCRLIATGESQDTLPYATMLPASFERRYAYVLSLGDDVRAAPGLLTRFLSVMAHPLYQAQPTQKHLRGHALLLPEDDPVFDGTGFIRPDAFLEAVDGKLHDRTPANALCGELAGQLSVDGAQVFRNIPPATWETEYRCALRAWELLPWQFPLVSTPAGWIGNPLTFFQRYHLRELLRPSLIPLSQAVMLFWGLLTGNWPMMLLALFLPEFGKPLHRREDFLALLSRIILLPTSAAVNVAAMVQLLRRKPHLPPDWSSLEAWTQGLTATVMAALVFLLPAGAVAAFILAVLFPCFPLAHRFTGT